jgi:hypothetical protein
MRLAGVYQIKNKLILHSNAVSVAGVYIAIPPLQFIIDKKIEHLTYVSSYATDTVDAYIISESEADFVSETLEKYVVKHHLMKEEVAIQNCIISYLAKTP